MKKLLLVLAMVAASIFIVQPAMADEGVTTTSQDSDPPVTDPVVDPPVVIPPVVDPPAADPPVVDPPVVDPPAADPPVVDPPAADPPAADPPAADPPVANEDAATSRSLNLPEICPILTALNPNSECEPTCDQAPSLYSKGRFCPPQCDEEVKSPYSKGGFCPPKCDDEWTQSMSKGGYCHPKCDEEWTRSMSKGGYCHPKCDDKWTSSKSRGGHCAPKCHDHKRGKDYSHSDDKGDRVSSYSKDKKGHGKHSSHCPRPQKCEDSDKKHDHKWWKKHRDDEPTFENMKYGFSQDEWSHSRKHDDSDKKHKHDCPEPKDPADPADPGNESGVLPDTGGAPLWVLLMGGMLSAAGITILVRRTPVRSSDSAGGGH